MSSSRPLRALVPSALDARLARRTFLGGSAAAAAALGLAACASPSSGASGGGGSLSIYTWGEYDDPTTLTDFTAAEGPSVIVDSYSSNSELAAKLSTARGTSGYDICVPTHSYVAEMGAAGLLKELDLSRIPNFSKLSAAVVDTPFDPGNKYSVCKDWGSTGYVYDTSVITRELTSWADFLDAAQNEASGSFSLMEDQGEVSYTYFFANGIDPNTTDPDDLAAFRSYYLDNIAQHVQAFESYSSQSVSASARTLMHAWNGDARLGILSNPDPERYRFVWPSEGANLWQDNWAIVEGAENEDAAYAFIDYVLDPEASLKELAYIGYNTGVEGIEEAATAAGVERPDLIFIDDERMSKLVYSQMTTATQDVIAIFDEIKAKAGQ